MKKILSIAILSLFLTGCGFLPRLQFGTPGTTPQSREQANRKEVCDGTLQKNPTTGLISCTKGYYLTENSSSVKERVLTWKEKIINFLNGLAGWSFILLIAICFLFPGIIGWVIGRVFNVFKSALTGTVRAINNVKRKIPTVTLDGKEVPDPTYTKAVNALLDELEKEHTADVGILKTIAQIRLQLKIEANQ